MTQENIEKRLPTILVEELRLEDIVPEDIDVTTPLFGQDGVGLDSLDAVELVVIIEKHFGLRIADAVEAKEAFTSVRGLAEYIVNHKA